ncbi:MAG: tol-pal system-associated acyl-CoA thioesterase [Alphaproteobacteria bacterium]|nr:tol-pal system-associated acyl-CoA thioesterase [Alphaproteobacteria bacterium]MCB9974738.1 tol-pal system-associated acyl-CoA thioesterase [Rhodospirillales bacterium]
MKHILPVRIYYEDTDAGGVVYHANFLKFAERGRTEFLRTVGYQNRALEKSKGLIFVVRRITVDYLKPAFLDDALIMQSSIEEMKNSSFTMRQTVYKPYMDSNDEEEMELICEMHVVLVCVNADTIQPLRIPEDIKQAFLNYRE